VRQSRQQQLTRQHKTNAHLSKADIKKHCQLSKEDNEFFSDAIESLGLSARAYDRILKVARTIADLKANKEIHRNDLSEAIAFRNFD